MSAGPSSADRDFIPEHPAGVLSDVERQAHDWVVCFSRGNASPADLAAFRQWSARHPAHVEAFERACRLWKAIGPAHEILAGGSAAVIADRPRRTARRAFLGGALAASAAGVAVAVVRPPLGLWPSWPELAADHRTAIGEQRSVTLAGGPSLQLNTRTSIAVRPLAGGADRIELISGEAAIETTSAMRGTIEVVAADGRVTASDAAFNMRHERGLVVTTCVAGRVEVAQGNNAARLQPGEQVVYSPAGLAAVTKPDLATVNAWKDGLLVFHMTPLDEAIADINRYRSGRIILTNAALGRRPLSARFRVAHVEEAVAHIQRVFTAQVTSLPGGIVLLG